jgi:hypothetical protein
VSGFKTRAEADENPPLLLFIVGALLPFVVGATFTPINVEPNPTPEDEEAPTIEVHAVNAVPGVVNKVLAESVVKLPASVPPAICAVVASVPLVGRVIAVGAVIVSVVRKFPTVVIGPATVIMEVFGLRAPEPPEYGLT